MPVLLLLAVLSDPLNELLQWPAPPPGEHANVMERMQRDEGPPPDDAHARYSGQKPSDVVRERLIDAIEKQPESVAGIVEFLPSRTDVCERAKKVRGNENVSKWLFRNCVSERDALAAAAAQAVDAEGYVSKSEELVALARADWSRAEPVLKQLAGSEQPRTRALAPSRRLRNPMTGCWRASTIPRCSS